MARKNTIAYRDWLGAKLTDPNRAVRYLNAAMEDSQGAFLKALRKVSESYEKKQLAESAGVSRESLYRMLSETGNPTYESLSGILAALGLKLTVALKELAQEKRPDDPQESHVSTPPAKQTVTPVAAMLSTSRAIAAITEQTDFARLLGANSEVSRLFSNTAVLEAMQQYSAHLQSSLSPLFGSMSEMADIGLLMSSHVKNLTNALSNISPDFFTQYVRAAMNPLILPEAKGAEPVEGIAKGIHLVSKSSGQGQGQVTKGVGSYSSMISNPQIAKRRAG